MGNFGFRGRRQKFGATRVEHDSYSFASKLESSVYRAIKARELAGELRLLQVQDHVYLTKARILFMPDFKCLDLTTNQEFWIEAKGIATPSFNIKKKLWKFYGPGRLEIYKGSHLKPYLDEIIEPNLD